MNVDDAIQELIRFRDALAAGRHDMSFKAKEATSYDNRPFREWIRQETPGSGASKGGVYFISDVNRTVLYIGKATTDNMAPEIYGKFSAPTEWDPNDMPFFGNSSLAKWADSDAYADMVKTGRVLINAVLIEPREYSSLAEVYLHTWCFRNKDWPPLNKRIG